MIIFALTGLTSLFVSDFVMETLGFEKWGLLYILGYIFIIFPMYHRLLLGYAFLFGKFDYFMQRIKKIIAKLTSIVS
jgi:hypothetical protein